MIQLRIEITKLGSSEALIVNRAIDETQPFKNTIGVVILDVLSTMSNDIVKDYLKKTKDD